MFLMILVLLLRVFQSSICMCLEFYYNSQRRHASVFSGIASERTRDAPPPPPLPINIMHFILRFLQIHDEEFVEGSGGDFPVPSLEQG